MRAGGHDYSGLAKFAGCALGPRDCGRAGRPLQLEARRASVRVHYSRPAGDSQTPPRCPVARRHTAATGSCRRKIASTKRDRCASPELLFHGILTLNSVSDVVAEFVSDVLAPCHLARGERYATAGSLPLHGDCGAGGCALFKCCCAKTMILALLPPALQRPSPKLVIR